MQGVDYTHDPHAKSWVPGADEHLDFPIQNLPLGVFQFEGQPPHIGCAIGDYIFDVTAFVETGELADDIAQACRSTSLNALFALPERARGDLRRAIFAVLDETGYRPRVTQLLYPAADCVMLMPARIGDYTDFYIGIHHATNIGRLFRPDMPLLPNYKSIPIAYHGRASTVVTSPDSLVRPSGQRRVGTDDLPLFSPSERLDYEVELGVWIAGDNPRGTPVGIEDAPGRVAGLCLLNDWSARDIQAWEYQPLGPFLSKNFTTTISPWVITAEALAPFRAPAMKRGAQDPAMLPYLDNAADRAAGGYAIEVECFLSTATMRQNQQPPFRISKVDMREAAYWTVAQMVAHHGSGGCSLRAGDLLGTGTLSGSAEGQEGSLIERTRGGSNPITLESGEQRSFLADGDEITLRAAAHKDGFRSIGFGACTGRILPAITGENR